MMHSPLRIGAAAKTPRPWIGERLTRSLDSSGCLPGASPASGESAARLPLLRFVRAFESFCLMLNCAVSLAEVPRPGPGTGKGESSHTRLARDRPEQHSAARSLRASLHLESERQ